MFRWIQAIKIALLFSSLILASVFILRIPSIHSLLQIPILLKGKRQIYIHNSNVNLHHHSILKVPIDLHSEQPTLFITISRYYIRHSKEYAIPNFRSNRSNFAAFLLRSSVIDLYRWKSFLNTRVFGIPETKCSSPASVNPSIITKFSSYECQD
jgi:hypothetical protein